MKELYILRFFIVLTILVLLGACEGDKASHSDISDHNRRITLIFEKKADLGEREVRKVVVLKNKTRLTYRNDFDENVKIHVDHKYENDTIVIDTNKEKINLTHYYYEFEDRFQYQFQPGDTVYFQYDEDLPKVSITNRAYNDIDLNFNYYESKKFDDLLYRNKLQHALRFDSENFQSHWDNFFENLKAKKVYIDSLYRENEISEARFVNQYLIYAVSFRESSKYFSEYINPGQLDELKYQTDLFIDFPPFTLDSLLDYSIYRGLAFAYATNDLIAGKKIRGENYRISDYRLSYDSLRKSDLFSSAAKKYLFPMLLDEILENFGEEDFYEYFEKFKEDMKDTAVISRIEKAYLLEDKNLKNDTGEVHLLDVLNNGSTLQSELNKYRGKLVYLDLWASWCLPCVEEMESSNKLRESWHNKDVVFIYLSIDKDKRKWQSMNDRVRLSDYPNSFIVINSSRAEFFKNLNIQTIPRYVLFGKNGEIIEEEAPRPSDEKLERLILTLLKE